MVSKDFLRIVSLSSCRSGPKPEVRSFSMMNFGLCIYHSVVWSNFNYLYNFPMDYYYNYITPWEVFTSALADGLLLEFEWQKSSQVSRTLLGILTDCNNSVVSTRPLISKSSSPFTNLFMSASRSPVTIGITVTFMFHNFSSSLARSSYLSFFSISFNFAW